MMINEITQTAGRHARRKRVGRGESSGHGKTCTRGTKGCQSRAGGLVRPLTEGGQMPIFRRLPKRGFNNAQFRVDYAVVNVEDLEAVFEAGQTVDPAALAAAGLVPSARRAIKILGSGALTRKLAVTAHAFSAKARQAIEQAGGTATLLVRPQRPPEDGAERKAGRRRRPAADAAAPSE